MASLRKCGVRDFPVVQWLRNHAPKAGGPGIPGQGTRSHVPQLSSCATTKTQHSKINIHIKKI